MTKGEIDRLGSALREGKRDEATLRVLDSLYESYEPAGQGVYTKLVREIRDFGFEIEPTIAQRQTKSLASIVAKLSRQRTRLSSIQDIIGCRIIVANRIEQDDLLTALVLSEKARAAATALAIDSSRRFAKTRTMDRNESSSSGYRAIHVIVTDFGPPYEIQLRTRLQNRWAQLSELLDDTFPGTKYGKGPPEIQRVLLDLSARTHSIEREFFQVMRTLEEPNVDYRFVQRQEARFRKEFAELNRLYDNTEGMWGI